MFKGVIRAIRNNIQETVLNHQRNKQEFNITLHPQHTMDILQLFLELTLSIHSNQNNATDVDAYILPEPSAPPPPIHSKQINNEFNPECEMLLPCLQHHNNNSCVI